MALIEKGHEEHYILIEPFLVKLTHDDNNKGKSQLLPTVGS